MLAYIPYMDPMGSGQKKMLAKFPTQPITFRRLQGGQTCHGGATVVCLFQYKVMRYAYHL